MPVGFLANPKGKQHEVGDTECSVCDVEGFVQACPNEGCDGLMHAHLTAAENQKRLWEGRCDRCGIERWGARK